MNATALLILAIVVVVLIALGLFIVMRWRRSQSLREQFGPEYKHAVKQYGDPRKAETELAAREKRVRRLEIRARPRRAKPLCRGLEENANTLRGRALQGS